MAKRLNSVLGVDVGSQSVKVAEIRLQGNQPVITALGIAPTPEGAVDHVGINDPEAVAVAVKQAIMESGASAPDAVSSLSGQGSVLVRQLEVPNMSESELKDHMAWEFTRNIPFAESTVETDFKSYPLIDPAAQNVDVVMAMATHSSVETHVQILKKAGRKPAALDVEPLGLLRSVAVSYGNELAGKTVCVAELGHKTTSINIYKDERLLMARQVPVGGLMFTQAIADAQGVSLSDAETMKKDQLSLPDNAVAATGAFNPFGAAAPVQSYNPFADPSEATQASEPVAETAPVPSSGSPLYSAVSAALDELVSEIRRSVDYFKNKGGDVDVIYLTGGSSQMKNLDNFLKSALGVDVQMFDPMKNISMSLKKGDPGMIEQDRQEFAVAIGNGMHICF
ncbi:MAG: type IV pilus assembly protein PilM [Fimbriimonadaceae bacterium]|nr:MAG: type IV pilus assembly protein PilM [Fimbriimonadaceae bacterium]